MVGDPFLISLTLNNLSTVLSIDFNHQKVLQIANNLSLSDVIQKNSIMEQIIRLKKYLNPR